MKTMKMKVKTYDAYIKANRKGSRDAELMNSTGWSSTHKVHKSKETYNRKSKYKEDIVNGDDLFYV